MFTGIIEDMGLVVGTNFRKGNLHLTIKSKIARFLKKNESVAHNGVCLSVNKTSPETPFGGQGADKYEVMAVKETLSRSNLGKLIKGDSINLERSLPANGRLDGHFVLGHADGVLYIDSINKLKGSHVFTFHLEKGMRRYVVEKGSIALNGVSLTVAGLSKSAFSVAIIPYTFENTNFKHIKPGDAVNVEFDIIGKYILGRATY